MEEEGGGGVESRDNHLKPYSNTGQRFFNVCVRRTSDMMPARGAATRFKTSRKGWPEVSAN